MASLEEVQMPALMVVGETTVFVVSQLAVEVMAVELRTPHCLQLL
jgi:hypothetical protein